ncbi:MAG: PAS domain S-box protein [Myxococcales bacterium]
MRRTLVFSGAPAGGRRYDEVSAELVSSIVAIATALTAVTVLVGWATGRPALTMLGAGISMKPNTAVCFLLLAAALWTRDSRPMQPRDGAASVLAAAAGVLGVLTLLEHIAGLDLGMDQLLFREPPGMPGTSAPARMGPPASSSFFLLGTALAIGKRGRAAAAAAEVMALATAFVALLSLVGYAYGTTQLYTIALYTEIALPTAVLLEALAVAVILVTPDSGLLSSVRRPGIAGLLARRALVYSTLGPLVIGWLIAQGRHRRLFDGGFAISLLVLTLILAVTVLILRDAAHMGRIEAQREIAIRGRERSREELRGALDRLRSHADNSPLAMIEWSSEFRVVGWTGEAERMFGWTSEEVKGKRIDDFRWVHVEDWASVQRWMAEMSSGLRPRNVNPSRNYRRDGSVIWCEWYNSALLDPSGKLVSVLSQVLDVTARKQAEEAQRRSEERARARASELEAVLDAVPAAVFMTHDRDSRRLEGNRLAQELLGLPSGGNFSKTAPPAERPTNYRLVKRGAEIPAEELPIQVAAARGEDVREYELDVVFEDGSVRHLLGNASPLRDGRGAVEGAVGAWVDVTATKRAEQALRESEQRARMRATELQALLDAVPAGVFIARDPEAKHIEGNRFGMELLRVPRGANASKSAPENEAPRYRVMRSGKEIPPEELPAQLAAARGIDVRDWECEIVFEGAPSIHLLGYATPLRDERGAPCGSVTAYVDITQRVQAESEGREATRRKDEFLAMLSHELRNPLAPIRNAVFLLARPEIGPEQTRRGVAVIERQVSHLTRLVEDLLDVSRISRGKVQLRKETVDLAELVRRTCEDHRPAATSAGLELDIEIPDAPLWVDGDPTRVAQIAGNLLSNAVKFTPAGGRVIVSASPDGRATAELRVRDTGVGIGAAMRARLFEPFAQADTTLDRSRGGLGLGLTLVKALVDLHGGSIEARSDGDGRGADFIVRLPLGHAPQASGVAAARSARGFPLRILLVEDNVDAAETLAEALQLFGHDIHVSHDGEDGLVKAQRSRPEVVLCDIGLPGINGYEVARAIRADENLRRAVLVAVTGYASPADQKQAADAGFDHHFPKPVELDKLIALLDEVSRTMRARAPA